MRLTYLNPSRLAYVDAIASSRLPRQTRTVAVELSSYADPHAVAAPGVDALAEATGLSHAQVGKALRDLVVAGYATRSRHPNHGAKHAFDRYALRLPA